MECFHGDERRNNSSENLYRNYIIDKLDIEIHDETRPDETRPFT